MIMIVGIGAILMVVLFAVFCVNAVKEKTYKSGRMVVANLAVLLVAILLFRYCFPWAAGMVLYQGILLHLTHAVPVIVGLVIGLIAVGFYQEKQKTSLAVTYGILALAIGIGGPLVVESFEEWQTAREYTFEPRQGLIE